MEKYYDYKDSEYFVKVERKDRRADIYIGKITSGEKKAHAVLLSGGFASYIEYFRPAKDLKICISNNTLTFRGKSFSY